MVQEYVSPIRVHKYPFEMVMAAYERRFPNCPQIPVVVNCFVIEDSWSADNSQRHTTRRCQLNVEAPYLIKRMIGLDYFYFIQENHLDLKARQLVIKATNETFASKVGVIEKCRYYVHPENPQWTCFEQQAQLDVKNFFGLESTAEKIAMKQYAANIAKGKELIESFMEEVYADGVKALPPWSPKNNNKNKELRRVISRGNEPVSPTALPDTGPQIAEPGLSDENGIPTMAWLTRRPSNVEPLKVRHTKTSISRIDLSRRKMSARDDLLLSQSSPRLLNANYPSTIKLIDTASPTCSRLDLGKYSASTSRKHPVDVSKSTSSHDVWKRWRMSHRKFLAHIDHTFECNKKFKTGKIIPATEYRRESSKNFGIRRNDYELPSSTRSDLNLRRKKVDVQTETTGRFGRLKKSTRSSKSKLNLDTQDSIPNFGIATHSFVLAGVLVIMYFFIMGSLNFLIYRDISHRNE